MDWFLYDRNLCQKRVEIKRIQYNLRKINLLRNIPFKFLEFLLSFTSVGNLRKLCSQIALSEIARYCFPKVKLHQSSISWLKLVSTMDFVTELFVDFLKEVIYKIPLGLWGCEKSKTMKLVKLVKLVNINSC